MNVYRFDMFSHSIRWILEIRVMALPFVLYHSSLPPPPLFWLVNSTGLLLMIILQRQTVGLLLFNWPTSFHALICFCCWGGSLLVQIVLFVLKRWMTPKFLLSFDPPADQRTRTHLYLRMVLVVYLIVVSFIYFKVITLMKGSRG